MLWYNKFFIYFITELVLCAKNKISACCNSRARAFKTFAKFILFYVILFYFIYFILFYFILFILFILFYCTWKQTCNKLKQDVFIILLSARLSVLSAQVPEFNWLEFDLIWLHKTLIKVIIDYNVLIRLSKQTSQNKLAFVLMRL